MISPAATAVIPSSALINSSSSSISSIPDYAAACLGIAILMIFSSFVLLAIEVVFEFGDRVQSILFKIYVLCSMVGISAVMLPLAIMILFR